MPNDVVELINDPNFYIFTYVINLNPILTTVVSPLLLITSRLIVVTASALRLYMTVMDFLDWFHCGTVVENMSRLEMVT